MKLPKHVRRFFLVLGVICLVVPGSHLIRFAMEREDIWWTPHERAVSIEESKSRVEVYFQGTALDQEVRAGHLLLVTGPGHRPVQPQDVSFRFNNWDRVRANRIPLLISAGVATGIAGTILLLSLLGWGPEYREERNVREKSDIA